MSQDRGGCLDSLASLCAAGAILIFAVIVLLAILLVFVAAIAVARLLWLLFRKFVVPQFYPATAVFAEQRMFGAPPDSQLFSAFDYWLLCLEKATGLKFTETPGQLFVGSILVSLAPALVIGVPLSVLEPTWGSLLPTLALFGLLFGGFTGYRLGQPLQGWFEQIDGGRGRTSSGHDGGFTLGDEDW